jgi:hypothetical protein
VNPRRLAGNFTEDIFDVYGFVFRFRTNHSEARRSLTRLYQRFPGVSGNEGAVEAALESDRTDGFRWLVGESAGTTSDLPGALWGLEAALCQAIVRSQQSCMAVHASALYAGDSANLIVGRSGAGKTTLSLALARRGLAVGTDDVALVEPETLNIFAVPRCFHLDDQSVALLKADGFRFPPSWSRFSFMVPSDLCEQPMGPCRAQLLVFVSEQQAEEPVITPISQAEMAARLLSETGQGPLNDLEIVRGLCRLTSAVSCYSLIRGPLGQTADLVAGLVLQQKC